MLTVGADQEDVERQLGARAGLSGMFWSAGRVGGAGAEGPWPGRDGQPYPAAPAAFPGCRRTRMLLPVRRLTERVFAEDGMVVEDEQRACDEQALD